MRKNTALAAEAHEHAPPPRAANQFKLVNGDATRARTRTPKESSFEEKLDRLQTVALSLVHEVKALGIGKADVDVSAGIDFYDEVRRFEANLIRQALVHTDGHQVRAARLLGLGVTTLNSIIKRYGISPHDPARDGEAESDEEPTL